MSLFNNTHIVNYYNSEWTVLFAVMTLGINDDSYWYL